MTQEVSDLFWENHRNNLNDRCVCACERMRVGGHTGVVVHMRGALPSISSASYYHYI
jgi:hypothetical protein